MSRRNIKLTGHEGTTKIAEITRILPHNFCHLFTGNLLGNFTISLHGITRMRQKQNGRHFADGIYKCILLYEWYGILVQIWLKFVPRVLFDNKSALVQIMAWHHTGYKPLSEPMMAYFTHTYMHHTQPPESKTHHKEEIQYIWVKSIT